MILALEKREQRGSGLTEFISVLSGDGCDKDVGHPCSTLVRDFFDHGGDLEPVVFPLSLGGILGEPVEQPEGSVFECLDGLMGGSRAGWGIGDRMPWERIKSGEVQVERLEKANAG